MGSMVNQVVRVQSGDVASATYLRLGWRVFKARPWPMILGWFFVAGAIGCGVLLCRHVSKGLVLGIGVSSPILVGLEVHALSRVRGERALVRRASAKLRGWIFSSLTLFALAYAFDRLLLFLWVANPLSGALMFGIMTFGLDDMYTAGLLDLWIWHTVLAVPLFMVLLGFVYTPLLQEDGVRPIASLRRIWRMVTGHRLLLFGIALKSLWLPTLLAVSALFSTVATRGVPALRLLPASLWFAGLCLLASVFGPWFSCTLAAAYVPLKEEDDEEQRRVDRRVNTQWFRREP